MLLLMKICIDHASIIKLPHGCKLAINWKKDNGTTIFWHNIIAKFFDVDFDVHLLVQVSRQIILELRQILFIKDLPEIQKSEILVSFKVIFSNLAERVLPQYWELLTTLAQDHLKPLIANNLG